MFSCDCVCDLCRVGLLFKKWRVLPLYFVIWDCLRRAMIGCSIWEVKKEHLMLILINYVGSGLKNKVWPIYEN